MKATTASPLADGRTCRGLAFVEKRRTIEKKAFGFAFRNALEVDLEQGTVGKLRSPAFQRCLARTLTPTHW